jgi:sugar/nucleoside kinase (ribokinase family)
MDVGWFEDWLTDPNSLDLLSSSDLFFPNEREAELMTRQSEPEAMLDWMADHRIPRVALKLGSRGAMLLWEGDLYRCPAFRVKPVDTTGAGDCFNAGFIYAWLHGQQPEECLRTATICGALSTRGLGGIATFPSKLELEEALEAVSQ